MTKRRQRKAEGTRESSEMAKELGRARRLLEELGKLKDGRKRSEKGQRKGLAFSHGEGKERETREIDR